MAQDLPAEVKQVLLYRGVHAHHPALAEAKAGVAAPGDVHGTATAEEHNLGLAGVQKRSPFTSFTSQLEIARIHARRNGPGGIILVAESGAPKSGDSWHWEWSPDEFFEDEVLLRGIRTGLGVLKA